MKVLAHLALFLLTVLEMTLGVIAGVAALVSVITEMVARATAAGGDTFARRAHVRPVSRPRLTRSSRSSWLGHGFSH